MNPEIRQAEEVFAAALAISDPSQRATYLDQACGGDDALRQLVERLLRAHDEAGSFLGTPAAQTTTLPLMPGIQAVQVPAERPGDQIGRYKLLEQIGEGGFGTVWMAEQEEPVRRRVVLKLIKLGMDTRQVLARFEAERQSLALMDHPHIARVFDGGATATGRPYFVMELVRGIPISAYCDARKLSTRERLELFIPVCQAVQHAHQKGIIHRDLKPSNILVAEQDDRPVAKVIDFGVAKATQAGLTERTLYTEFGQALGTPAYMSPEQASLGSLDVDTRSDVYSLGVLLYELLTGRTPFDTEALMKGGYDTVWHTIREVEPPKPSTRLNSLRAAELAETAALRRADPQKLRRLMRGELDWIVMKCLEKDRRRRYETANGLVRDLQRHLQNEPITARPPSTGYRIRKTLQRNRGAFTAAVVVVLALATGLGTAVIALKNERISRQQTEVAERRESRLRTLAEEREQITRQRLYVVDMKLAQLALNSGDRQRAVMLLDRNRPLPGQPDLRQWEWRYFWKLARSDELFTLGTHSNVVTSIAISRDGRFLVSGSLDSTVKLWNLPARHLLRTVDLGSQVFGVAMAPDGTRFAVADMRKISVWSTDTVSSIAAFPQDRLARAVCFSADGSRLAAYVQDGTIYLWDLSNLREEARFAAEPLSGSLRGALAFSPDGSTLAIGQRYARIRLINIPAGTERAVLSGHSDSITALAFTSGGDTIVSSSWDHTAKVWNLVSEREWLTLKGHTAWVSSLALSPDSKTLATVSADQTIRLWEVSSGRPIATLQGHLGEIWAVAFGPDGTIASGGKDDSIKFWSATPRPDSEPKFDWDVRFVRFAADGQTLAILDREGRVLLGDAQTLKVTRQLTQEPHRVLHFCFSPRENLLATAHIDGRVQLWDPALGNKTLPLLAHTKAVRYLHFSQDGKSLYSLDVARNLKQWDVVTGNLRFSIRVPQFTAIEFSPDHRTLAGETMQSIHLLDLPGGTERAICRGHREPVRGFSFSPDGRHLASAGEDGTVRIWDAKNGRQVALLMAHRNGAYSVAFSSDGRRLVSGAGEDEVKLWDTATLQEIATFRTAAHNVVFVTISPDNQTILARTSRGWDLWRAPGPFP